MLIGRVGEGSNLWLDGDFKQVDSKVFEVNNGLNIAIDKLISTAQLKACEIDGKDFVFLPSAYLAEKKIAERMKITIIAGARPNFMKIAPLMRSIHVAQTEGRNIQARLVYTGSAQDKSLEPSLFQDLDMPCPDTCLNVESNDFFQRLASIIVAFAEELDKHPADLVMVVDDLTPTIACSIVARKKGIKIAHKKAIRTFSISDNKKT